MATPEGPAPGANPLPPPSSAPPSPSGSTPLLAAGTSPAPAPTPKPPPEPLTGFRSALEHTGIPRSVLLYKPKLPSRNWLIFWTILSSVSGAYIYDRREAKRIKEETIERVAWRSKEVLDGGSLGVPRKVEVWGAKWGGDEDTDRALRHFRKYVKPYLVAAGVDYHLPTSPLHGSITRQVHAQILSLRRRALGLEPTPQTLSLPGVLDPEEIRKRELEGGVVLVGRASLKEYMEGLRRGWMGGVGEWDWEKEVVEKMERDGLFNFDKEKAGEGVVPPVLSPEAQAKAQEITPTPSTPTPTPAPATAVATAPAQSKTIGGLSFLSRPGASALPTSLSSSAPSANSSSSSTASQIPESWHVPPSPLPAQPPILLVPFVNHLGFTQIPHMIYSFFTERHRVQQGSAAALALIESHSRPLSRSDLEFGKDSEEYYNKTARQLPERVEEARKTYYEELQKRVELARQYEYGEREMTEEEKKSGKVVRLDELKEERKKKELRWMGNLEGWDIVRPETDVAWEDGWEGWLKVFDLPKE